MKVESLLVTGANRGIGLEFVRQWSQLADPPRHIFATYRNVNSLKDLKAIEESSKSSKIILIKMDITRPIEIETTRRIVEETVGERGLNLLINNAGVAQSQFFPNITAENLNHHLKVNTEGPLMFIQAMMPSLEKAALFQGEEGRMSVSKAAVLNMTSAVGSITNTGVVLIQDLAFFSYKISKAALNMAMRAASVNAKDKGILVIMMCPGDVKTDMRGTDRGELEPKESIEAMMKTLHALNESHHGSFLDRFGNPYQF